MTVFRQIAVRMVVGLPTWAQVPVRRAISSVRDRLGRLSPRDNNALTLPGSGPVVLLDARGRRGDAVLEIVDDHSQGPPVRLVVLIDDPAVHLFRSLPVAAVEYLPTVAASTGIDRIDMLRRTYRVDRVVVAGPHQSTVT